MVVAEIPELLAERLKKRSEEMLGSLGSELATIKERGLAI